jgi:beta-lactamase superfamily II metal-dependent hydrolase
MKLAIRIALAALALSLSMVSVAAFADGNGKLQVHFMDVGQADGIVIISPKGQVVLVDGGMDLNGSCNKQLAYMQQIGVKSIDYAIASHYHFDHIACTPAILKKFPLKGTAYDRGGKYPGDTYKAYVAAVGSHRKPADAGSPIKLDNGDVRIDFVAMNGNGVETTNENDLSIVAVLHYGDFDVSLGGDLSGFHTDRYEDIETSVAPLVGQVEVYKVHHHCSVYSTNDRWLDTIQPRVGVISTGNGNGYDHPNEGCVERLHVGNVELFWTEAGDGVHPDPSLDRVWKNILVEVETGGKHFTVKGSGGTKSFDSWPASSTPFAASFAWSVKSTVYHKADCPSAKQIKAENLRLGSTAPEGKEPHSCVQ